MINMAKDPIINVNPKDSQDIGEALVDVNGDVRNLAAVQNITLTSMHDCVLYAGNLWPQDQDLAKKEYDRLVRFYEASKELAKIELNREMNEKDRNTRKEELKAELESLEIGSRLVQLAHLVPEFAKIGRPILTGISSPVFSENTAREYGKARATIKHSIEEILAKEEISKFKDEGSLIRHAVSRSIEQFDQTRKNNDTLNIDMDVIDAARAYDKLGEEATVKAGDRYTALTQANLMNKDDIIVVRGKNDRRSTANWLGVKNSGVEDIKLDPNKPSYAYRIAYFGGYNYEEDKLQDAPDELITPVPAKGDLEKFLEENDFDAMVFSGSSKRLNQAIKNVNDKYRQNGHGLFGRKNKPKLHNRLFIVSNSDLDRVNIDYDEEQHNLIVEGVNYYHPTEKGSKIGKMLLLDPRSNSLAVIKMGIKGEKNPLESSFEILDSCSYRDGRLMKDIDFARRDDRSSSSFSGSLAKIGKFYKQNRTAIGKATVNVLRYGIPFVLGTAAGVLGYSYFESNGNNSAVENLNKQVKGQQEIIDEYDALINKYITQRTAKKE